MKSSAKRKSLSGMRCFLLVSIFVAGLVLVPAVWGQKTIRLQITRVGYPERGEELFAEMIPAFEKEYPNIKAEFIPTGWSGWTEKVFTWVAAGTDPDVHTGNTDLLGQLIDARALLPLDSYIDEDLRSAIDERLWKMATMRGGGKTYQIPSQLGCFLLWYNRSLFKNAGLDADAPPTDWYELLGYSIKITNETGTPAIGSPCFLRHCTMDTLFGALYYSATGQPLLGENGKALFNTPRGVEALKFFTDLTNKWDVTQANPLEFRKGSLRPVFRDAKVSMIIDGSWLFPLLMEAYDFSTREACEVAPAVPPRGPTTISGRTGDEGWAISSNTENPDAAWKLLRFVVRPEWQYKADVIYGNVPAQKSEMAMPEFQKWYWQPFIETLPMGFPPESSPKFMEFSKRSVQQRRKLTSYMG